MKMMMAITLDGLVRALRWKAIEVAEGVQHGTLSTGNSLTGRAETGRNKDRRIEEGGDDRGRG